VIKKLRCAIERNPRRVRRWSWLVMAVSGAGDIAAVSRTDKAVDAAATWHVPGTYAVAILFVVFLVSAMVGGACDRRISPKRSRRS
jgi:hypothetical protein